MTARPSHEPAFASADCAAAHRPEKVSGPLSCAAITGADYAIDGGETA